MLTAYKFRLYPNEEQKGIFSRYFGYNRVVWNKALEARENYYKEHKDDKKKKGLNYSKNTSKKCSDCGWKGKDLTLADRIFKCSNCGLEIDCDVNAAKNIMRIGVNTLSRRGINARGDESSTTDKAVATIISEAGKSRSDQIYRFRSY